MQPRRNVSLLLAVLPTIALIFGLAGFALGWQVFGRGGVRSSPAGISKVRSALSRIEARYYPGVSQEVLLDGALEGMATKLDPYCEYFTAKQYQSFKETHLTGEFYGVGIRVTLDRASGFVAVETPIEDSPAFAADILPGDQIREVDGWSTKGRELAEVIGKIKGVADTPVTLTMFRKGREPFRVALVRKKIVVKAVKARLLDGGIGYVRITDFTEMMAYFDKAVARLREDGAKALIVDLRFNGGGLLSECVELSDRFLEKGLIVSTKGRTKDDGRDFEAKLEGTLPADLPLVVLVNEGSASASEIFTGAMKDHKRGVIVGARTYGKGSVQTPFELPDGSHLKLTTARYYTPSGTSVHREEGKKEFGIEPDLRIEMSQEEYAQLMKLWNAEEILKGTKPAAPGDFKDLQLEAGLEVLRARLAKREPKVEPRVLGARKAESED